MNGNEIFSMALGLVRPWSVERTEFVTASDGSRELHIWIRHERGFVFNLPDGSSGTAYDTVERTWRHLNFFQYRCYLHCPVPRVKHGESKISTIEVPWARPGSGFTLLMEAFQMLLIEKEMPVSSVSATIKETAPRIWRVFHHWVKVSRMLEDWSEVRRIGVDETSRKKGHRYITQFVDLDTRRTLFATEGKDAETFKAFRDELINKGGNPEQIEIISMDMSAAFMAGRNSYFPKAQIVFDKFHIVKMLNEALDDVRRCEHRNNEFLKGHRYTLLRRPSALSRKKLEELDKILVYYPTVAEAYGYRESFMDVFGIADSEEAKGFLMFWCDSVMEAGIQQYRKFVNTIKSHWTGVAAYFDCGRITNGLLEGINTKIQLAKRRARGYANTTHFIDMIYFMCGKLELVYPRYLL